MRVTGERGQNQQGLAVRLGRLSRLVVHRQFAAKNGHQTTRFAVAQVKHRHVVLVVGDHIESQPQPHQTAGSAQVSLPCDACSVVNKQFSDDLSFQHGHESMAQAGAAAEIQGRNSAHQRQTG